MSENPKSIEETTLWVHADWDRNDRERRELAIKLTNEKFGTQQGNATLDYYTPEQQLFFAKIFFDDDSITKARITAVKNISNGFNEFFIEANSNAPKQPAVENPETRSGQEMVRCQYCVTKNLSSNTNCSKCGAPL